MPRTIDDNGWNRKFGLPQSEVKPKKRKSVTINDLLTKDDINGILADLEKIKPNIKDLIVIYMDKNNKYSWQITGNTLESLAVWLLESVKLDLLNNGE